MPNIFKPEFEVGERPEGFRSRRARIGYELIRCGFWELPPGEPPTPTTSTTPTRS